MIRVATILPIVLLLWSPPSLAQQRQGDVELQFTGSFQSNVGSEDVSTTIALAQAKLGYFVSDRIEVGAYPSLTYNRTVVDREWETRQVDEDSRLGMGLFVVYSFLMSDATTVPYVGAQYYESDVTNGVVEDGWAGVNGGVKLFLNRSTAFDIGGNVLFDVDAPGQQLLLLQVGLSFLL